MGRELAYAELWLGLAGFMRRFECELYETGKEDVELWQDLFVARVKAGSKGVRVLVKAF